jgi:hypothetical protein
MYEISFPARTRGHVFASHLRQKCIVFFFLRLNCSVQIAALQWADRPAKTTWIFQTVGKTGCKSHSTIEELAKLGPTSL